MSDILESLGCNSEHISSLARRAKETRSWALGPHGIRSKWWRELADILLADTVEDTTTAIHAANKRARELANEVLDKRYTLADFAQACINDAGECPEYEPITAAGWLVWWQAATGSRCWHDVNNGNTDGFDHRIENGRVIVTAYATIPSLHEDVYEYVEKEI